MKPIRCIGGACIDYKLLPLAPLHVGTSNPVTIKQTFGGVARNVAENLAHWTQEIYLQCVVGDDEAGKKILQHMQKLNVDTRDCVMLKDKNTAQYFAVLNEKGDLHIACNEMSLYENIKLSQLNLKWGENSIVFLDTNFPAVVIEQLLRASIATICIDPVSVSKAKKLPKVLTQVFLLKPNQDELAAMTGLSITNMSDVFVAANALLQRGVEHVVVSLGENGYVIVNNHMQKHFGIEHTKMLDANGAGDAFIAGILYGLQCDATIIEACEWGQQAAVKVLQTYGSSQLTKGSDPHAFALRASALYGSDPIKCTGPQTAINPTADKS